MKKTFLLTVLFTILLIAVIKISEAQSPVAYYQFSGNANDAIGTNHGTVLGGAALTTNRFSQANSAHTFDGSDDKITVPDAPAWDFGTGDFSLTAWVNVTTIGTQRIVSAGYAATGDIWGLGFGQHPVWGTGIRINFFLHNGAYVDYSSAAISYTPGTWAFIAVVRSGTLLSMYYNNTLVGTATTSLVANAGSSLTIGARQESPGNYIEYFNGKIDEVHIYNKAISQQHLSDLYASNLVAYYPYSGNSIDYSGYSNNGTASGALLTTDRFSSSNSAYSFNGSTDNIQAPNNASLALVNNYSITAWVKAVVAPPAAGSSTGYTILSKDEAGGNNIPKWIFALQNGGLAFHINGPGMGGGHWLYSNTFTLTLNQWYHCAMSKSGNNMTFYVNGANLGTFTLPVPSVDPNAPLSAGYSEPGINFNGSLDQLKLYNTTLTETQIKNDFSNTALSASYMFSGNANDESGNGNHGTVTGSVLTTDRFGNANSAYSFDGTGSTYITVPNHSSLQLSNSYTLSAWIKPNAFYLPDCQLSQILQKGSYILEGSYGLWYTDNDNANCGVVTPNEVIYGTSLTKGGTIQHFYQNPATQTDEFNKWIHLVSTYDGTTVKVYINGKLRTSGTSSGVFGPLNTTPLYIGRSEQLNVWAVSGVIDDIKIYNVPLPATEIFDTYLNELKKPGSGNSVLFDNTQIQAINVGTGFDQTGSFSFETWVKRTSANITDANAQTFMASQLSNGWSIGINQSAPANRIYLSKVQVSQVLSSSSITDTKWHHIAVTYNATTNQVIFYFDGIPDPPVAYSPGGFVSANSTYRIGGRNNGINFDNNLNGSLDEVRVWNGVVLTEAEIRNWMCKKINSSHPQYASLNGYFRLDEGTSTITGGYNARFGTLENGPVWQTSGAALGDASVHDYVNATKTANISHAFGENFSATETAGTPAGIHVYRVDEKPNSETGANNGGNNKYFGVFQAGGTSPQYTAVYNYTGNPLVNTGNESSLRLGKRADNSITTWTQMPDLPNEPGNTITVTGESTEYILGAVGSPLPVTLLNFAGSKCANAVCLIWSTENEQNFSHFEAEKSNNGNNFTRLTMVTANNQPGRNTYNSIDLIPFNGFNYYRLKIVNMDGSFSYSQVIKIDFSKPVIINIQPNPASDIIYIKGLTKGQIKITDISGKLVLQKTIQHSIEEINISSLLAGIYVVQVINENAMTSIKLVKQ